MAYQALYRKWRPLEFEDVKGQEHIVTTLKNQIRADRIGHAYLFCGTRGTGKTTVAKIFAKAVNCEHPVDGSPCGECPTCKAIAEGRSMNVIEIDAASNNGVDNIREIRDEVQYSPTEGRYKVYIIDEVHMLSIGAFNALLKTLEEPPAYVIFILATTEAHKIPVTILSRCQRYDFHRISIETIAGRLSQLMEAEHINVEEKAIRYVAKAADGSMRDALSLLDQCIAFYLGQDLKYENVLEVLGAVDTAVFAEMLSYILKADTYACMQLLEQIIMQGRDLGQFVSDFVWYLRNLLLVKTTDDEAKAEDIIDVSADNLEQLKKDSKQVDVDTLMRYIRVLSELANELKFSTQKRIKVEVTLIKLTRPAMEQRQDMGDVISRITLLEQEMQEAMEALKNGVVAGTQGISGMADIAGAAGNASDYAAAGMAVSQPVQKPQGISGMADIAGAAGNASDYAAAGMAVSQPVQKRVIEAMPEDIKQLAKQWDSIVHSIEEPLKRTHLLNSHVTLAEDGQSLELMTSSPTAYELFSREGDKAELVALIEERTGIHVNLIVTKLQDGEDFQNRFTDIRESVNMEIEVDDKEEYI